MKGLIFTNFYTGIGTVTKIDYKESNNKTPYVDLEVNIKRSYKDKETGEYITDTIPCRAYGNIAVNIHDWVSENTLLGIKAELQNDKFTNQLLVVINKATFLSSKRESEA